MNDDNEQSNAALGLEFLDAIDPMIEMLDGYRAKLLAHGYSDAAAEQMCVQMHGQFMHAQKLGMT